MAPSLRARDGRSALVLARIGTSDDDTPDPHLASLITRLAALSTPAATVRSGGQDATNTALNTQIGKDLGLVSAIAVPITVVLLFFVFGGVLAAALPLVMAGLTIMGTFAVLHLLALFVDVSTYAIDLNIALGLGLAVDNGLLIVTRYREECARGATLEDALAQTLATAGRTVLFSGVTVALSLTALLVFSVYFLRSFGYAGIAVSLSP